MDGFRWVFPTEEAMKIEDLAVEQQAEASRIRDILMAGVRVEVEQIAVLLASRENRQLLGETEFRVRDAVHRLGARAYDAALSERKKRGTKGRA